MSVALFMAKSIKQTRKARKETKHTEQQQQQTSPPVEEQRAPPIQQRKRVREEEHEVTAATTIPDPVKKRKLFQDLCKASNLLFKHATKTLVPAPAPSPVITEQSPTPLPSLWSIFTPKLPEATAERQLPPQLPVRPVPSVVSKTLGPTSKDIQMLFKLTAQAFAKVMTNKSNGKRIRVAAK
jgi:hypothetical protein